MRKNKKITAGLIWAFVLVIQVFPVSVINAKQEKTGKTEETLLMFVGETLDVLSIASRREESAWKAPAVAMVITKEKIKEKGITTLGQALSMTPGFYIGNKEWGSQPYLRGIPDSVLFLYDTVPMGSDVSKSIHPVDYDLSLYGVKRIEIIRGPGSVLWGPDAFAGIVNVVPMTGKDLNGVEAGVLYSGPYNQVGVFANGGYDGGTWDIFLSASGRYGEEDNEFANVVSFWGDGTESVQPALRYDEDNPGDAAYFESSARFAYHRWLSISGRISKYRKPYTMVGPDNEYKWIEKSEVVSGQLKLEGKKDIDPESALRFTGSFSFLRPQDEIIDMSLNQRESSLYGEIIYDRSFLAGKGLFTGGLSFREKHVRGAPIWDSFLPDHLGPENISLLPIVTQKDYNNRLWSIFGQYTHKIGSVDLWVGLRYDNHDKYEDNTSYTIGGAWNITPSWIIKMLYGTAYRTPFARQVKEDSKPDLEEIKGFNVQVAFKPSKKFNASIVYFNNRIANHVAEDFTGLSEPNEQDIDGLEFDVNYSPLDILDLNANFTFYNNSGPDESYFYNDFTFIRPDGSIVRHYTKLSNPYDGGADTLFNFTALLKPVDNISLFARLYYSSSKILTYPGADSFETTSGVWLMDGALTIKDIFSPGFDLSVSARNLFDANYKVPGTYSIIDGKPLTFEIMFSKKW